MASLAQIAGTCRFSAAPSELRSQQRPDVCRRPRCRRDDRGLTSFGPARAARGLQQPVDRGLPMPPAVARRRGPTGGLVGCQRPVGGPQAAPQPSGPGWSTPRGRFADGAKPRLLAGASAHPRRGHPRAGEWHQGAPAPSTSGRGAPSSARCRCTSPGRGTKRLRSATSDPSSAATGPQIVRRSRSGRIVEPVRDRVVAPPQMLSSRDWSELRTVPGASTRANRRRNWSSGGAHRGTVYPTRYLYAHGRAIALRSEPVFDGGDNRRRPPWAST